MAMTMPDHIWPSYMTLEYLKVFLPALISLIAIWVAYKLLKPVTDKRSS